MCIEDIHTEIPNRSRDVVVFHHCHGISQNAHIDTIHTGGPGMVPSLLFHQSGSFLLSTKSVDGKTIRCPRTSSFGVQCLLANRDEVGTGFKEDASVASGRVIAVANQKGGVGKTTTAVNLAACIANLGKRVLLIDIDPQGNTTSGIGVNKADVRYCVYDVIINDVPIQEAILPTCVDNLSVLPATIQLAGAEIELVPTISREVRLRRAIQPMRQQFEYIVIDCPPSLGLLTVNALTAADSVLIPIQCEYYALEGLSQLLNTIRLVQKHLNTSLEVEGVLLTMLDARTNLGIQVIEDVKKYFRDKVYQTIIPRNVRLSEAPSHGQPIIYYDPKSKGAETYMDLAKEVVKVE
jgi:chromosome partitioning protein